MAVGKENRGEGHLLIAHDDTEVSGGGGGGGEERKGVS